MEGFIESVADTVYSILKGGLGFSEAFAIVGTYAVVVGLPLLLVFLVLRFAFKAYRRNRSKSAQAVVGTSASGLTEAAMEELERAQALFKQGAITNLEFERLKAKIINM